jgi:hypothetical protein
MRTEKKFRLKTNLPGGHIAGEMVTDRSTGVWYWESTGMTCPYQPENEPQFFEIEHVAKFEVGDEVMLSYKASKISRLFTDKKSILKVIEVCKKSNIIHEQRYKVSLNRKHFTLAESELQSPVFYWFIGYSFKCSFCIAVSSKNVFCKFTILPFKSIFCNAFINNIFIKFSI